jgi:hypothetical protein
MFSVLGLVTNLDDNRIIQFKILKFQNSIYQVGRLFINFQKEKEKSTKKGYQ